MASQRPVRGGGSAVRAASQFYADPCIIPGMLSLLLAACINAEPPDKAAVDADGDGAAADIDCDDTSATVHPGADETCNQLDDDCDDAVDEDAIDAATWVYDGDDDGYGVAGAVTTACAPPEHYTAAAGDCNDNEASVHPGANEVCNALDDDCDDAVDEDAVDPTVWYTDADGDGFGAEIAATTCDAPAGSAADNGDCDDTDASVFPDAPEHCDERDADCDGEAADADSVDALVFYVDGDADGYGRSETVSGCAQPAGAAAVSGDCDDGNAAVHPGTDETCDGIDGNCDGEIDENSVDAGTWFVDADGDGYGSPAGPLRACTQPAGYEGDDADCDDADPAVHDDAIEVCNGIDDNCDGETDEAGALGESVWYLDADGDGFGSTTTIDACDAPPDYVADTTDCDDGDPATNPAASEYCAGGDENCDGVTDEDTAVDAARWCEDADGDGYGAGCATSCLAPAGWIADNTDCDDADADINPGERDLCDSGNVDADCSGSADDAINARTYYTDADADGYGDSAAPVTACVEPAGVVTNSTDCNDAAATVNPGQAEVCRNGIDDNCDEAATGCSVPAYSLTLTTDTLASAWYTSTLEIADVDGDGIGDFLRGAWSATGQVSIYTGPSAALLPVDWTVTGGSASARTGYALNGSGDSDLDGTNDLLVGAPRADDGATDGGAVSLFYGPFAASRTVSTADASFQAAAANSWAGTAVAMCDVSGDGLPDTMIGAPAASGGNGNVYVLESPLTGTYAETDAWADWEGAYPGGTFGTSLACFGDADGDGVDDALVGAPDDDGTGAAYVMLGSVSGATTSASAYASLLGVSSGEYLGGVVAAGDVNGDGERDAVLGAIGPDSGTSSGATEGRVQIILGPMPGTTDMNSADATVGSSVADAFGASLAVADVNGDGFDDVAVGSSYDGCYGYRDHSELVVWLGDAALVGGEVTLATGGCSPLDETAVGFAVDAGDMNGDGYAEVVAGYLQSGGGTSKSDTTLYMGNGQ